MCDEQSGLTCLWYEFKTKGKITDEYGKCGPLSLCNQTTTPNPQFPDDTKEIICY